MATNELPKTLKEALAGLGKSLKGHAANLNKGVDLRQLATKPLISAIHKLTNASNNLSKTFYQFKTFMKTHATALYQGLKNIFSNLGRLLLSVVFNTAQRGFQDVQTARNVGLTGYQLEKWKYIAKQENVDSGAFTGLASGIQQAKYDPALLTKFAMLGGNISSMITGGAKTDSIMTAVLNRLSELGKTSGGRTIATMSLSQLGLDFSQFSFLLNGGNTQIALFSEQFKKLHPLTTQQLEEQKNLQQSIIALWTTFQNVAMQFATAFTPITQAIVQWGNGLSQGSQNLFGNVKTWASGVAKNLPTYLNEFASALQVAWQWVSTIGWAGLKLGFTELGSALQGLYDLLVDLHIVKAPATYGLDKSIANLTPQQVQTAQKWLASPPLMSGREAGMYEAEKSSYQNIVNQNSYKQGVMDYDTKLNQFVSPANVNQSDLASGNLYQYKNGASVKITQNNYASPNYSGSQSALSKTQYLATQGS